MPNTVSAAARNDNSINSVGLTNRSSSGQLRLDVSRGPVGAGQYAAFEHLKRQPDAGGVEPLQALGPDARAVEIALGHAHVVHAGLLVGEDVLHGHDLAFHARDLGDFDDAAGAALKPGHLHDQVDSRSDLPTDDPDRHV